MSEPKPTTTPNVIGKPEHSQPPTEEKQPEKVTLGQAWAKLRNNAENVAVVKKLIYTTLMMLLIPLTTFFVSRDVIASLILGLDDSISTTVGAVAALVAIQIIVWTYVYMAFQEGDERVTAPEAKKEQ